MASNGVTKQQHKLAVVFLALFSFAALAGNRPSCGQKWMDSPFGENVLKQKKNDATFKGFLASVSRDYLASAALDLDQRVLSQCSDPALQGVLQQLQVAYLARLGVKSRPRDASLFFRGLVTSQAEGGELEKALSKISGIEKLKPLEVLAKVYGAAVAIGDVLVVGAAPLPVAPLKGVVRRACERFSRCPFWDPAFIARVVIVPGSGQAAYLPEVASLRIASDLVDVPSPLRQVVLFHELAHVAQWRAKQQTGADWVEEFKAFSGWSKTPQGWQTLAVSSAQAWNDELTKESAKSPYSLLPDNVFLAGKNAEEEVDGFVFARSERETKKSGDVSEDLADHVAAYLVVPHRFCHLMKPVAPKKYEWIARNVFQQTRNLDCQSIIK